MFVETKKPVIVRCWFAVVAAFRTTAPLAFAADGLVREKSSVVRRRLAAAEPEALARVAVASFGWLADVVFAFLMAEGCWLSACPSSSRRRFDSVAPAEVVALAATAAVVGDAPASSSMPKWLSADGANSLRFFGLSSGMATSTAAVADASSTGARNRMPGVLAAGIIVASHDSVDGSTITDAGAVVGSAAAPFASDSLIERFLRAEAAAIRLMLCRRCSMISMDMSNTVRRLALAGVRVELNGVSAVLMSPQVREYSARMVAGATPNTGVHGVPDRSLTAAASSILVEDASGVLGPCSESFELILTIVEPV